MYLVFDGAETETGSPFRDELQLLWGGRSVRSPTFKYHAWSRGEGREQLFDITNDPGETNNLVDQKPYAAQLAAHRQYLADWLSSTDDPYGQE